MNLSRPISLRAFPTALDPDDQEHLDRTLQRLRDSPGLGLKLESDDDFQALFDSLCRFGPQDLEAACRAKWVTQRRNSNVREANDCTWVQVDGSGFEDSYLSFYGLQAALTWLLEESLRYGTYPTTIEVTPDRLRMVFADHWNWRDGVELRRSQPSSPASFPEQARYVGLLSGMTEAERPNELLVQRLRSLPGWGALKLTAAGHALTREGHAPLPKEWRRLAAGILHDCGVTEPTSAQVENVAACVLDFPSWNHLSAAYKAACESPDGLLIYRTGYCVGESTSFEQAHGTFEAALHSLVTAVQSTAKYASGWNELEVHSNLSSGELMVSAPSAPDAGKWRLAWSFSVSPNSAPAALQDWVRGFFDGRVLDVTTLREMFLANLDEPARCAKADVLMGAVQLARVGSRRLSARAPYPCHEGSLLTIHELDDNGVRKPGYGVSFSSDIACLLQDEAREHIVLAEKLVEAFRPRTVFTQAEAEVVDAIRTTLLPTVQKSGEAFVTGMTAAQLKRWRAVVKDCVKEAYPRKRGAGRRVARPPHSPGPSA